VYPVLANWLDVDHPDLVASADGPGFPDV